MSLVSLISFNPKMTKDTIIKNGLIILKHGVVVLSTRLRSAPLLDLCQIEWLFQWFQEQNKSITS